MNKVNQETAEGNRVQDKKNADDQANQKTLDQYMEDISKLLFDRKLRSAKIGDEVYTVARSRTLSVLQSLDGKRKVQLLGFLNEAKLFQQEKMIFSLRGADLSGANLYGMNLNGIDLSGANLSRTDLNGVDLSKVKLSGANLSEAKLSGATLTGATLTGVNFRCVDLRRLDFSKANLHGAHHLW